MSQRPFTTFEDFLEARQDFDQILTIHVSYASSYLALLQCNLVKHPICGYMGGLGHFEVSSTLGVPSPSYIKSSRSHTTMVQRYSWGDNHLFLCLPQGDIVVPPPHERLGFIQKVHSKLGHFGIKRIYSLLAPHYHWRGMYAQVQDVIARCEQCDIVKTSFSS